MVAAKNPDIVAYLYLELQNFAKLFFGSNLLRGRLPQLLRVNYW